MASSFPSLDFLGSPLKSGNAVTRRCRSVKRTASGSVSGCCSDSRIPRSSASSHVNSFGIDDSPLQQFLFASSFQPRTRNQKLGMYLVFFRHVIAVPCWNLDNDFARLGD